MFVLHPDALRLNRSAKEHLLDANANGRLNLIT